MARLTTRITEGTNRRLRIQAVLMKRSIEELVEEALQRWLSVVEKEEQES